MATALVSSQVEVPISFAPVPAPVQDELLEMPQFDPAIHLKYQPPIARHSFTELGLPAPQKAPNVCYTEPFQLFSDEGVRMLRRQVFNKDFLDKWLRKWDRAPCYIGGFSDRTAKNYTSNFIMEAWMHPATQAAINDAFGAKLTPLPREADVGYTNVMLGAKGLSGVYEMKEIPSAPYGPADDIPISKYDNVNIDEWHNDQVPVVCVIMLSDTSTMEGGETAIQKGDGKVIKIKGPTMGAGVLMQGGYTRHAALRANNTPERVSMVTSYGFEQPELDDSTATLRSTDYALCDYNQLLSSHFGYKLERLRGRIDIALEKLKEHNENGVPLPREEVEKWVRDQIVALKEASWEVFERIPKYVHKDRSEGALRAYLNDV